MQLLERQLLTSRGRGFIRSMKNSYWGWKRIGERKRRAQSLLAEIENSKKKKLPTETGVAVWRWAFGFVGGGRHGRSCWLRRFGSMGRADGGPERRGTGGGWDEVGPAG